MKIFEKVSFLCELYDIQMEELENACGFRQNSISEWDNYSDPMIEALQKVADYFSVAVDYFIDDKIYDEPQIGFISFPLFVELLQKLGVTISDFIIETSIPAETFSDWENGIVPDNKSKWKIGNWLNTKYGKTVVESIQPGLEQKKYYLEIPKDYKHLAIAFNESVNDLTQEDVNYVIKYLEWIRARKVK